MILFLYGPDTYRSHLKLKEIIEYYKKTHKSGLNLFFLDLKEKNYKDFLGTFQSMTMFKEKKLIVLENTLSNEEFKEKFLNDIKKFTHSDNIILFYEKEVSKGKFLSILKENAKWQNFTRLEEEKLKKWVKKRIKILGGEIANDALNKLIEFVGNNLWQMENEIKKLISYTGREEIALKDIRLLVKPKIETDIFKTIDAIAQKNKKKALNLIHKHLEKGESPFYLLSMINFQFRSIILIKDLIQRRRPLKEAGLHPYVVKKTFFQAKNFSFHELKKIYQKIFKIDLDVKSGRLKPETALDLLIAEI
ncbi:hypothetical protein AMJ49_00445 [Parcubacteria bacterium DG_74_2]|nr:MAG: hypothetical protein AMJ49_00445 [Parcubacteria bacterium DG_74_2]